MALLCVVAFHRADGELDPKVDGLVLSGLAKTRSLDISK
jgi:hypothetical protein